MSSPLDLMRLHSLLSFVPFLMSQVYPHITHYSTLERWHGVQDKSTGDCTENLPSPCFKAPPALEPPAVPGVPKAPGPAEGELCVVLRAVRPCPRGQQCFLFYGPLSTPHQLLFYGFISPPPGDHPNPFDTIPIGQHCLPLSSAASPCGSTPLVGSRQLPLS